MVEGHQEEHHPRGQDGDHDAQGVLGGGGVGGVDAAGPGQRCDAVAVTVEAKRRGRAGYAQHPGVVGDVGIDALGEVVEQRIQAAGGPDLRGLLRAGHMQGGVDRLEVVVVRRAA